MADVADNDRPLTPEGRLAAEVLAKRLRHDPIRAVYSSPYRRARETVEPIAAVHALEVHTLSDLRERRLSPASLDHASFVDALTRARSDASFALPGGESTREVEARAWAALDQIRSETGDGIAVAGTHGGLISILRWSLGQNFSIEDALAVPMPAVFPIEHNGDAWQMRRPS